MGKRSEIVRALQDTCEHLHKQAEELREAAVYLLACHHDAEDYDCPVKETSFQRAREELEEQLETGERNYPFRTDRSAYLGDTND